MPLSAFQNVYLVELLETVFHNITLAGIGTFQYLL